MTEFFHVDIITLGVVVTGIIVTWVTLNKDSKWHTSWIEKHSAECDKREGQVTALLIEQRTSNIHMEALITGHAQSIERIDKEVVRVRDRVHDLGDIIHKRVKP